MLIDLHCHSRHTRDCELDAEAVVKRAAECHLDGVCFTEANTLEGVAAFRDLGSRSAIKVFVGLEVETDRGHYLCYFPDPAVVPAPAQMWGGQSDRRWSAREVVDKVVALGGAVVAAHPYDRDVEFPAGDFIFTLTGLSAVESYNARSTATANELAAEAADHLRLACVAGSAARKSLTDIGRAATLFKKPVSSEAELVAALKNQTVWPVAIGDMPQDRGGERVGERGGRDARGPRRGDRGRPRHDRTRRTAPRPVCP